MRPRRLSRNVLCDRLNRFCFRLRLGRDHGVPRHGSQLRNPLFDFLNLPHTGVEARLTLRQFLVELLALGQALRAQFGRLPMAGIILSPRAQESGYRLWASIGITTRRAGKLLAASAFHCEASRPPTHPALAA